MIHDRPYMQSSYDPKKFGFLAWFAIICVAIFVIQEIVDVMFTGSIAWNFLSDWFALSITAIQDFKIWTLFSYALIHGGLLHILLNMLLILMLGSYLKEEVGEKAVAMLIIQAVVAGAVAFLLVNFDREGTGVVGASAAAVGVLVVYCLLHYEKPLTFMLFLVLPVTVKAKWILWVTLGIDLFLFATRELPGSVSGTSIAHSAHLGGAAAGFLFFRFALNGQFAFQIPGFGQKPEEATSWQPKGFKDVQAEPPKSKFSYRPSKQVVNFEDEVNLKEEVDRILDKINKTGYESLNKTEQAILSKRANTINRR